MSTLKTTYIQHPSATDPAIELEADGTVLIPSIPPPDLSNLDASNLTSGTVNKARLPLGLTLQVGQSTVTAASFSTTSTSFTTVTGMSVVITPRVATSKILLIAEFSWGGTGSYSYMFRFSGGNSGNYVGASPGSRIASAASQVDPGGDRMQNATMVYLDSPNTTSAVTYNLQVRAQSGGTFRLNRSNVDSDSATYARTASTITAIEVAA